MKTFFNQRNKKISNLNFMSDNLGHSLRENVTLFSVDDSTSRATFVTESGNIIEGTYYFGENMILDDIDVESGEVFTEDDKFDSLTKNQISSFIDNVYNDQLAGAGEAFDRLIESWTERVKFSQTVDKLQEQSESFNNTFNIIKTNEFERFLELSENISKFLKENVDKISSIPEIVNAVKLSDTVSRAFNIPRTSLQELKEKGSFEVSLSENADIYEMVCKQELVKKEILESKKSFDTMWVTEECISNLSMKIFEDDEEVIKKSLVEAFVQIPYLALVSKKQLSNTINNNLITLNESVDFSKNDLKLFVAKLFEMKKPLKEMVSAMLQEKYGVNVNNLKDTPTFKTLLNTEVLIFESLSKISPRGSAIRECLAGMADMLKSKNGVEAIDVNNGIKFLFENSGYNQLYVDQPVVSSFNLNEELSSDDDVVNMIMSEIYEANLDPVGKEDDDIDNDGKANTKSDKYLKNRRKAVQKAMSSKKNKKEDKEEKDDDEMDDLEEEELASGMTAKDLMKALKDIEALIEDPIDLEED